MDATTPLVTADERADRSSTLHVRDSALTPMSGCLSSTLPTPDSPLQAARPREAASAPVQRRCTRARPAMGHENNCNLALLHLFCNPASFLWKKTESTPRREWSR